MTEQMYTLFKMEIEEKKVIGLSSGHAKWQINLSIIAILIMLIWIWSIISSGDLMTMKPNILLVLLILSALSFALIYRFINFAIIELEGDMIHIHKRFGKSYSVKLGQVKKVNGFSGLRGSHYTLLKFVSN